MRTVEPMPLDRADDHRDGEGMRLVAWGQSEAGIQRQYNEDRFCCDPVLGLFIAADGTGKGGAGSIAAQIAVETLYHRVQALLSDHIAEHNPTEARDRLLSKLPSFVNEVSETVFRRSHGDASCHGIATTASLIQIVGSFGVVAHVGDSRVYMIRGGQSYQLTEDHTLVQELLRSGGLAPNAVSSFPHRNVLSRALGKAPAVEVDTVVVDVVPDDRLVICSDGLSDYVADREIVQVVSQQPPNVSVPSLIEMVRQRAGRDDVTAVVVEFHGERARPTTLPTQQKAGLLGQIFLCRDLSFQEIVRVLAVVHELQAPRGSTIIREGEVGDLIYLLAVGRAELSRDGIVRRRLEVGDHFGELALMGSGVHTVTVTAVEDTILLTLSKADLYNLVRSDHSIALKLLWGFLTKLGETVEEQATEITRLRWGRS